MPSRDAVTRSMASDTVSPPVCWSVATSSSCGSCFSLSTKRLVQLVQLVHVGIFQRVLILGPAHAVIDGDVLHRLHVQLDAVHLGQAVVEAANDVRSAEIALVERLEVDGHASAVQRGVGAVGADEGGEAFDRRVLQDDLGQLLLLLGHRGKGDGCGRLRDALDHARILHREESLGDDDVKEDGQHQRAQRHQQGESSGSAGPP